jgi:hypothetical protein
VRYLAQYDVTKTIVDALHFELSHHPRVADTKDLGFSPFLYRFNPDKTIDAICSICWLTAATGKDQDAVRAQEAAHQCWRTNQVKAYSCERS